MAIMLNCNEMKLFLLSLRRSKSLNIATVVTKEIIAIVNA